MSELGVAGRIAEKLIDSPLVPLVIVGALILGAYGLLITPREDRPNIEIPTAIVTVAWPGGGAARVDELVARPVAAWARQLADVAEVASAASTDAAVVEVEFAAGISDTEAYSRITELLAGHARELPEGVDAPTVRTFGTERLVVFMATLTGGPGTDAYALRRLAEEVAVRLQDVAGVRDVVLHGGATRAIQVYPQPARLAGHGITLPGLVGVLRAAGLKLPAGALYGETVWRVEASGELADAEDLRRLPVGAGPAGIVYLADVADVDDGPLVTEDAVIHWRRGAGAQAGAVTLAVTAVPRQNVSRVTERVLAALDGLEGTLIPEAVDIAVGYDAGREATERVYNVLNQLVMGTAIVIGIVWLGLGWRAAVIIALMMPTSLAIVPYAYYQIGYTLNPVSIAAMILAIGILADDAVIVLENASRLFRVHGKRTRELMIRAVNEVGNPTILADLLIVVTLMPIAYISGEMGQYVRAIPIGASVAVLFSLFIALTITPYYGFRLLRPRGDGARQNERANDGNPEDAAPDTAYARAYRRLLEPFLARAWARWALYAGMLVLLAGAMSLVTSGHVQVALTPMLDREVFVVDTELPPGTPLERTLEAAGAVGELLDDLPEVAAYTVYAGTDGPMLIPPSGTPPVNPPQPHEAAIYVQLGPEQQRDRLSFEVSRALESRLAEALAPWDGRAYIRNIPYGPSNERPVSAEIYAPDPAARLAIARDVARILSDHPAVTAVERRPEPAMPLITVSVDRDRAATRGVKPGEVARAVRIALAGATATTLRVPEARRPVPVVVRLAPGDRRVPEDLAGLYVNDVDGSPVPLLDVVHIARGEAALVRHRRNLLPLVMVAADLERDIGQPLTVQRALSPALSELPGLDAVRWFSAPGTESATAVYWGGEWEMTVDVYRDMGIAWLVVMVLIYVLLAGWFGSYAVPLLIMLPIPLVFIGVIPAHWLWGIDIAGMGVLGVIALAGIVTRNAILLVDFTRARQDQGMELKEALVRAGALRTRPIVLTAATVMFGSGVLVFEPSLEPLGLTLASGVLVSTLLTLLLIPVLYFHWYGNRDGS